MEEPNLSQQGSKQVCKCLNRDNISIMRPVLYHQSLQRALKTDLPSRIDNPSQLPIFNCFSCLLSPCLFLSLVYFSCVLATHP